MVEAGDTRWTPRVTLLLSLPACAPDSVVVEQAHGFCCFGPHQRAGVLQQQDQGCGHRVSKVRAVDTARSRLWTHSKVKAVDTESARSGL